MPVSQGNRRLSVVDIQNMVVLSEAYSFRYVGRMFGVSAHWVSEIVANSSHYMQSNNLSTSILNLSSVFLPLAVELAQV